MAEKTKIEWTDNTFSPWIGCAKISEGCANCYAEADFGKRKKFATWGEGQPRRLTSEANWKKPLTWDRKCAKEGTRLKVFAGSLCDIGDPEVPQGWFDRLLNIVTNTPNLDWLLLTKRPATLKEKLESFGDRYLPNILPGCDAAFGLMPWPLPNVWVGVSVENQKAADERIPILIDIPAAGRFISAEPLLGPVNIETYLLSDYDKAAHNHQMTGNERCDNKINWVICGGESGPNARPCHPDWVRSLRDQCEWWPTAFMLKQWGEWMPTFIGIDPNEGDPKGRFRGAYEFPDGQRSWLISKAAAGCKLDGKEHKEFPEGLNTKRHLVNSLHERYGLPHKEHGGTSK